MITILLIRNNKTCRSQTLSWSSNYRKTLSTTLPRSYSNPQQPRDRPVPVGSPPSTVTPKTLLHPQICPFSTNSPKSPTTTPSPSYDQILRLSRPPCFFRSTSANSTSRPKPAPSPLKTGPLSKNHPLICLMTTPQCVTLFLRSGPFPLTCVVLKLKSNRYSGSWTCRWCPQKRHPIMR